MSGARTGSAFSIAMLAAMVLACAGITQMHAQTQQAGTQEQVQPGVYQQSAGATSSSADATVNPSAASPAGTNDGTATPAGVSGGASGWTAGKASFGIKAEASAGSIAGATSGSWAAGSGSFAIKNQPGGIWRDSGGGSMGFPSTGPTQSSAGRGLVPAAAPGLSATGPATASAPSAGRSRGILASRSQGRARPTSGAHFGASRGFRSGGNRSMGRKPTSHGAHHQLGTNSHAGSSHESGAGSSSSHDNIRSRSAFTPSGSSTTGGMGQPGSGREPIP